MPVDVETQLAALTQLVKTTAETLNKIDARTEKIAQDIPALQTEVQTHSRNITQLWDGVNSIKETFHDRWQQHDQEALNRTTAVDKMVSEKVEKAEAKASAADKKAESILDRFRGAGYVWAIIGAFVGFAIFGLYNKVSSLNDRVVAMEARQGRP